MEELTEEIGLEFSMGPVMERYIYYFNEEIDTETVQDLIDNLSNYPAIDLFITTPGGISTAMYVLLHFLNNHPDIRIYLTGYIASAGTFLLTNCNKEIIIHDDLDWILFHMGDRSIEGQFRKNPIDHNILYNQLKLENEKWANKFANLGLNKKEIKSYLEGNDVVLYKDDFKRLKINKK